MKKTWVGVIIGTLLLSIIGLNSTSAVDSKSDPKVLHIYGQNSAEITSVSWGGLNKSDLTTDCSIFPISYVNSSLSDITHLGFKITNTHEKIILEDSANNLASKVSGTWTEKICGTEYKDPSATFTMTVTESGPATSVGSGPVRTVYLKNMTFLSNPNSSTFTTGSSNNSSVATSDSSQSTETPIPKPSSSATPPSFEKIFLNGDASLSRQIKNGSGWVAWGSLNKSDLVSDCSQFPVAYINISSLVLATVKFEITDINKQVILKGMRTNVALKAVVSWNEKICGSGYKDPSATFTITVSATGASSGSSAGKAIFNESKSMTFLSKSTDTEVTTGSSTASPSVPGDEVQSTANPLLTKQVAELSKQIARICSVTPKPKYC
jgi:hypothetical protein